MIRFLLTLLFSLFSAQVFAQNALLETLNVKKKQKWRMGLSATHLDGFGDSRVEPGTVFGGFLDHTIKPSLHLDISARLSKLYYVDFDGDDEWLINDVYVGLRHILKDAIKGSTPMISYGILLPTSANSIRQDIRSRFYLGGNASWMLMDNKLILTPGLDGVLNWNSYSTTKTGEQTLGGQLLPFFSGTASLSATYLLGKAFKFKNKFLSSLLVSGFASYNRTYFEDFNVDPVASTEFRNKDDRMSTGLSVIGSPYKNWFLSVGYGHNAEIENMGRTEYYIFDSRLTRWRVGLRHTLRF